MEYLFIIMIVCAVLAGVICGTHDLLAYIHAPEVLTWAVPLTLILIPMGLFTFWCAMHIYTSKRKL